MLVVLATGSEFAVTYGDASKVSCLLERRGGPSAGASTQPSRLFGRDGIVTQDVVSCEYPFAAYKDVVVGTRDCADKHLVFDCAKRALIDEHNDLDINLKHDLTGMIGDARESRSPPSNQLTHRALSVPSLSLLGRLIQKHVAAILVDN